MIIIAIFPLDDILTTFKDGVSRALRVFTETKLVNNSIPDDEAIPTKITGSILAQDPITDQPVKINTVQNPLTGYQYLGVAVTNAVEISKTLPKRKILHNISLHPTYNDYMVLCVDKSDNAVKLMRWNLDATNYKPIDISGLSALTIRIENKCLDDSTGNPVAINLAADHNWLTFLNDKGADNFFELRNTNFRGYNIQPTSPLSIKGNEIKIFTPDDIDGLGKPYYTGLILVFQFINTAYNAASRINITIAGSC